MNYFGNLGSRFCVRQKPLLIDIIEGAMLEQTCQNINCHTVMVID